MNPRIPSAKLSEKHIQKACDDFLALDDWRIIKTDLPHLRGLGVQERGIPDRLYIRYLSNWSMGMGHREQAQILWVEYKRQRGGNGKNTLFTKAEKAKIHQLAWHALERERGALVWLAGEDFEPTIESFQKVYRESGLMRRKI